MMSQCKVQVVSALLSVDSVHQSCAEVCRNSNIVKEQPHCGSNYWRPMGDPRCPQLASRVFSVLKLQKTRVMLVVLSCLMAGEPYLRRQPDG